jgi:3-phenylpropionate/trans-cinnamate dioxygenase ferredoxin reductase component
VTIPPSRPDRAPRRIVIAGAGLAATQTVAALRERGFDGHLTVLGAEQIAPYDRPPLSKHLLDRPGPTFLADELGVDIHSLADVVRLGEPVSALRADQHGVELDAGETHHGDAVVIATGARARRVVGWEHALVLHTADDAAALRARLSPGARLVIIGAGWIGAEVAGVAAAGGVDVTVLEAAAAPLSGAVGASVGRLTAGWFAAVGVRLRTGAQVVRVTQDAVHLADGSIIEADVVLAAVGAAPATAWLAGTLHRDADGSIPVDETYTALAEPGGSATAGAWRVRAVGDVARRRSRRHGWVPGGHWDGALRGPVELAADLVEPGLGIAAAVADPVPYVFSTQLGHELTLFGLPGRDDDVVLRGDPDDGSGWTALWFRRGADTLTALLTVDRPRDVGAARRVFAGDDLPRLDVQLARDPRTPLKDAVRT